MLVKLEAYREGEFWCARGIGVNVVTQGETLDGLLENAKEALSHHFKEKLEQGETLQVSILVETEVRGQLQPHKTRGSTIPLSNEEIQHRRNLMQRILKRRNELPLLGMTTTELVRLARQGLESYDAS